MSTTKKILAILAIMFLFFVAFLIFLGFLFKSVVPQSDTFSKHSGKELIAVVEIKNVILDSKKVIESLIEASEKKEVKAVVVRIDSPGGAVAPTQEIYNEIRRIDQEIKPVYASFGTVSASGGYYIGSAARKIYALPGTLTGSIGVIMQFFDASKLYQWAKVSPETIKSGKYKDVGNPARGITRDERKYMESVTKDVHQQFIDDILMTRKDRIKGEIRSYAEGQVFSGKMALEYGLVDDLASLWEAARKIHKELGLKGKMELVYVKGKKEKFSLPDFFDYMEEATQVLKNLTSFSETPVLMYRLK